MPTDLSPEHLQLRRTVTFRLRTERRLSWRAISAALAKGPILDPLSGENLTFQISPTVVRDDYFRMLREYGYVPDAGQVDEARAAELQKLDALEDSYWPRAVGGPASLAADAPVLDPDEKAAAIVLRIMRQRAQLAGLNAPTRLAGADGGPIKVEFSVPDDAIISLVQDAIARKAERDTAPSMN